MNICRKDVGVTDLLSQVSPATAATRKRNQEPQKHLLTLYVTNTLSPTLERAANSACSRRAVGRLEGALLKQ